jgi:anti-sigma regulatory factor (Ser/Thr protein kinase)
LFLATPEAVPAARHALSELNGVDQNARNVLELLTSELVTNAVRHGASDPHESILFHATRTDGAIRVEVCDEGGGFQADQDPGSLLEPGGHGLLLVETLAERWGVNRGKPNCVWFEQPVAQAA